MKPTLFKHVLGIFMIFSSTWTMISATSNLSSSTVLNSSDLTTTTTLNEADNLGKIIGITNLPPDDTLVCVVLPRKTVEAIAKEQNEKEAAKKIGSSVNDLLAKSVIKKLSPTGSMITPPASIQKGQSTSSCQNELNSSDMTQNTTCPYIGNRSQKANTSSESPNDRSSLSAPGNSSATPQTLPENIVNTSMNDQVGTCPAQAINRKSNDSVTCVDPTLVQNRVNNPIPISSTIASDQNQSPLASSSAITKDEDEAKNQAAALTSENSSDLKNAINQLSTLSGSDEGKNHP
jgi:hypothetical protein